MELRNVSLDVLRIMACFGVIIVHTAGSYVYHNLVGVGSLYWQESVVMDGLVRWCVPIFVMLTGFFFLNLDKELPLKKLYGKKILRLMISVIFWTLFYAITIHTMPYYPFGSQNSHFWYIGMCIGLYISMPVMRMIASNEKLLSYSCWIWLFIECYCFIGRYVEVPIVFTDYVFTDYVGYCLWGYYLSCVKLTKKQEVCIYILGLIALIVNSIIPLFSYTTKGFAYETPGVVFSSLALFLFVLRHPLHFGNRIYKVIGYVSKLTLGIYMVHIFVLTEIFFRVYSFITNPVLLVPVIVLAVFFISLVISIIISKIPFVGKWVV